MKDLEGENSETDDVLFFQSGFGIIVDKTLVLVVREKNKNKNKTKHSNGQARDSSVALMNQSLPITL